MHRCVEIIRYDEAGGVRTVSDLLGQGLSERDFSVSFVEVPPPPKTLFRSLAKKVIPNNGKIRSFAQRASRLISKHTKTTSPISSSPRLRIYTHPNLVQEVSLRTSDVNIGWYHDSWETARRKGHAEAARRSSSDFWRYVLLSEEDALLAREDIGIECISIPNALPSSKNVPSERTRLQRFVMLTRHEPQKDIPLALHAWKTAALGKDWELVIFGSGSQYSRNQRLIRSLKLDNVKLTSWTSDPLAELALSHALLSTSIHEGFPASFLEALSTGTPIVAVDSFPACKKLVTEATGKIIGGRKILSIANAIREMALLSSEQYNTLTGTAQEKSHDYDLKIIVNRWLELFQSDDEA